ncbi:MAG: glycosyltransferase [Lachnospiraceae bacterium]|nr:glycosyltransferase [Lachnospiraceae bacterium]
MGKLSPANWKKTVHYFQRNGLRDTWYAARERLVARDHYSYQPPAQEILDWQRGQALEWRLGEQQLGDQQQGERQETVTFSIVVPAYRTEERYLRELAESVRVQSYPFWELILADATEDDSVERVVSELVTEWGEDGDKLHYYRLPENRGISGNTNQALEKATGEYIGLLDHDDLLTPDALFEMADEIRRIRVERGFYLQFLYSDEDKCDSDGIRFYEPNRKENFNYDLLLSNNYICHFLVMKRELLQKLRLRQEYDGAQDYDLLLRATTELKVMGTPSKERLVAHIPRVLYHWRCHETSTAQNPQSKRYAYEAGKRALEAHLEVCEISGKVRELKHVGFYEVLYTGDIFAARKDLGAVGGPVIERGRIVGGRMKASGKIYYEDLPVHYSGYLHRAVLTQDARAVDIRNIRLRKELWEVFEQTVGVPYVCKSGTEQFDASTLPGDTNYKTLSLALCRAIRKQGYRILWRRENE